MTTATQALSTTARLLTEVVSDLDCLATDSVEPVLPDDLLALAQLDEASAVLASIRKTLGHRLGEAMGEKRITVDGFGTFERHRRADRKEWDRELLLRDVLDSRFVDTDTGEMVDEMPLDKVLEVWNLGAPRVAALRHRGLDPDDYCHVERGGWAIQIIRSGG